MIARIFLKREYGIFTLFILSIFLIFLADGAISYIFPIVTENSLQSNGLMGMVMAVSSLVGLICDFSFPQLFYKRSWKFFLLGSVSIAFLFPIFTTLGAQNNSLIFFLLAAAIWGIYFEMILFSMQKFLVSTQKHENFSKDWGIFATFISFAHIFSPILGAIFINLSVGGSPLYTLPIFFVAFLFVFVFISLRHPASNQKNILPEVHNINFFEEFKFWFLLIPKIYPILIAGILLVSIDAAYWTFGGLFGEVIFHEQGNVEWLVLLSYMIPSLFGYLLIFKLRIVRGKKRFVNLFLALSGFVLSALFFAKDNLMVLGIILVSSFILSLAIPLLDAVFSDLAERMGKLNIHMIGISRLTSSTAYIFSPLLLGLAADQMGYFSTFGLIGLISGIVGLVLLFITPRKLKLPQKEMATINS